MMRLRMNNKTGYGRKKTDDVLNINYEFSLELHKKLKEKIKGKIFSKVENDALSIRIDIDDLWFKMRYTDFSERVMLGSLSTDMVVNEVCDKYRKFLINYMEEYYFKENTEVN